MGFEIYPDLNCSRLFTKLSDLHRKDYDWSREVAAIKGATMLAFADADAVRAAHIVDVFGLLGGGQMDAGWDVSGRPTAAFAIWPGFTYSNDELARRATPPAREVSGVAQIAPGRAGR